MYAKILDTSGGLPVEPALRTATVAEPASYGLSWRSVAIDPPLPVTAGHEYAIVLAAPTADDRCYSYPCTFSQWAWGYAFGTTYSLAVKAVTGSNFPSWTLFPVFDAAFKTYVGTARFDSSAPVIGYILDPAAPNGSNGWYTGDVALSWSVSEPDAPASLAKIDCVDQSVTADQAETSYSCAAQSDGGAAAPVPVSIKRDAHAPQVDCGTLPTGWQADDVRLTCTAADVGPSGLADAADAAFALSTSIGTGTRAQALRPGRGPPTTWPETTSPPGRSCS
jgi:hypothetical protein